MDVALVQMPFAEVQRPSIALGLLRAALGPDIESEVIYGNLRLAETIGLAAYQAMQSAPTDHLLGEWCFASCLFPVSPTQDDEYLNLVVEVRCHGFPDTLEQRQRMMRWVRSQCSNYVDTLAEAIVARAPRIVGCSSVFQQHCASLALLKRVRELSPLTVTLLGGANCEGEMGLETLRQFPWVDAVISGEADALFRDLCVRLLQHGRDINPATLPAGVNWRTPALHPFPMLSHVPSRPVLHDLDALPTPDYDHYFAAWRNSALSSQIKPGLLAESSRGCWWGEKSHCTFCGLNGEGMPFRSKSPARVQNELAELSSRYGIRSFQFVDNILDMAYLRTLLPALIESGERYGLFYETKANLKRDQVQLLAEAGVRWIQPGIESLDDQVLRLIGKGNSALMNLQLLKWAGEFGIHAAWNMLSGIPGESDDWYAEMARWLPAIFHLQPPSGVCRVRYDRFSPYHSRPRDFGLTLEPSRAYAYVYPFSRESLMRLAYSFEDAGQREHIHRSKQVYPGQQHLQTVVSEWNDVWTSRQPRLLVEDDGYRLSFTDTRPCARSRNWTATETESSLYRLCDTAQSPSSLQKQLATSPKDFHSAVESLGDAQVLLSMNGKLLALAVRLPHPSPAASIVHTGVYTPTSP